MTNERAALAERLELESVRPVSRYSYPSTEDPDGRSVRTKAAIKGLAELIARSIEEGSPT